PHCSTRASIAGAWTRTNRIRMVGWRRNYARLLHCSYQTRSLVMGISRST
ncbi:impB/mucB/samB family protein, partial [Vibrio parahaemolyticus IDH02640]